MRHLFLQRILSGVLLVGMLATVLPFGPEALAEGQWAAWLEAITAAQPDEPAEATPDAASGGLTPPTNPRPVIIPATLSAGAASAGFAWAGVVRSVAGPSLRPVVRVFAVPVVRLAARPLAGRAISPRAP